MIGDGAIHQSEGAAVFRHDPTVEIKKCFVKKAKKQTAETFLRATATTASYDLCALAPAVNQFGNQFRRILQVTIEKNDCVTCGMIKTGAISRLLTEIAREANDFPARESAGLVGESGNGLIGAAIVDKDNFPVGQVIFRELE